MNKSKFILDCINSDLDHTNCMSLLINLEKKIKKQTNYWKTESKFTTNDKNKEAAINATFSGITDQKIYMMG